MKRLLSGSALSAALVLSACGCGSHAPAPSKSDSKSESEASGKPAETAKNAEPAAKTPEPAKAPEPAAKTTPAAPAKTETAVPAKAPPTPGAEVLEAGKASGFEAQDIGGKTIGAWVSLLSSTKKEEILEAIEYCRMVESKASLGIPKLTQLTKNPDKEIAEAAAEALKKIKK